MTNKILRLLLITATLSITNIALAYPTITTREVPAKAFVLMESSTNMVLASSNADQRMEPASLTKLMTAYVVYDAIKSGNLRITDKLFISQKARDMEGSRMFLELNTRVSVDDLLHGLVIQSGNDAAEALAEGVSGTSDKFVTLMNAEAKRMGMKNSHFMNVTGLPDPNHYSTAHDLAILANHIITDFPDHYSLYKIQYFMWNKITQPNRNTLLFKDSTVDGLKTGHTQSAGYCLTSSAVRNNMRLISVVLGADSANLRVQASEQLLNFGYQNFQLSTLYTANQQVATVAINMGKKDKINVGSATNLRIPIPKDSSQISSKLLLDEPTAPVKKGDKLGVIQVSFTNNTSLTINAIALESVEEVGFFKRLWLAFARWFKGLFA